MTIFKTIQEKDAASFDKALNLAILAGWQVTGPQQVQQDGKITQQVTKAGTRAESEKAAKG